MKRQLLIAHILFISLASVVTAQEEPGRKANFYDRGKEGWYWYQDPPAKEEKKGEEKEEKKETPPPQSQDPWTMPVEEFRKLLEVKRGLAIQIPTEGNVYEYLKIEEVARKKALAFTNVRALTLQKHPELNVDGESPLTGAGMRAYNYTAKMEVEDLIRESTEDFALVMFEDLGCALCDVQAGIVNYFKNKYQGWEVKRITASEHPQLVSNLGINAVPYTLLVYKKGKHIPVGTGTMSLTEMEDTIYKSIRYLRGDVSPEQYMLKEYQIGGPQDPLKK